jgi:uncharacterized protein
VSWVFDVWRLEWVANACRVWCASRILTPTFERQTRIRLFNPSNSSTRYNAPMPTRDLDQLLRTLSPKLQPAAVAFCELPHGSDIPNDAIGTFQEDESTTVLLPESRAQDLGLAPAFVAAWITLTVHSDLQAVGLTAAVSTALAHAGISCNVIAAVQHDHLFVPVGRAGDAMRVLRDLQRDALG